MNLVPIKIRIGLKHDGSCEYPQFNTLTSLGGQKWEKYIDLHGGWFYDKVAGHADDDLESPHGLWYGVILVEGAIAAEAVDKFPERVEILTEVEFEKFYNERVAVDLPEEDIDTEVLNGIKLKKDLGIRLTLSQESAIDPSTETRGVRVNHKKTWKQLKAKSKIEIS